MERLKKKQLERSCPEQLLGQTQEKGQVRVVPMNNYHTMYYEVQQIQVHASLTSTLDVKCWST